MNSVERIRVSYGGTASRIGNWRRILVAHSRMMEILEESERRWLASPQDIDCQRFACTDSLIAVTSFAKRVGLNKFAQDRLEELMHALAEANWGHANPLPTRAKMHPNSLSPMDRLFQGAAQTCVELFTAARIPVNEARARTARLFQLRKIKGLGVPTLAKLGSKLAGAKAKQDPTYDYYLMAMDFACHELHRRGGAWPPNESQAENIAKKLIRRTIEQDKRPK